MMLRRQETSGAGRQMRGQAVRGASAPCTGSGAAAAAAAEPIAQPVRIALTSRFLQGVALAPGAAAATAEVPKHAVEMASLAASAQSSQAAACRRLQCGAARPVRSAARGPAAFTVSASAGGRRSTAAAAASSSSAAPPVDPFAERTVYKDNLIDKASDGRGGGGCACTQRELSFD